VEIISLAERPDLIPAMGQLPNDWPAFMMNDPHGDIYYPLLPEVFPQWQLVALDEGRVVGKVHAVPFGWDGTDADLPDRGWDEVLERAFADARRGTSPTAVSLLEARLAPGHLGRGLSRVLLEAQGANVRAHGLLDLVDPVRPTGKHLQPELPMSDYVAAVRDDGLPVDPWLRVHVRMGGRFIKLCPASMVVAADLITWRGWTGLPFDTSGDLVVPFACNPVHVSVEQDCAVYAEPNVWVHHDLRQR